MKAKFTFFGKVVFTSIVRGNFHGSKCRATSNHVVDRASAISNPVRYVAADRAQYFPSKDGVSPQGSKACSDLVIVCSLGHTV